MDDLQTHAHTLKEEGRLTITFLDHELGDCLEYLGHPKLGQSVRKVGLQNPEVTTPHANLPEGHAGSVGEMVPRHFLPTTVRA